MHNKELVSILKNKIFEFENKEHSISHNDNNDNTNKLKNIPTSFTLTTNHNTQDNIENINSSEKSNKDKPKNSNSYDINKQKKKELVLLKKSYSISDFGNISNFKNSNNLTDQIKVQSTYDIRDQLKLNIYNLNIKKNNYMRNTENDNSFINASNEKNRDDDLYINYNNNHFSKVDHNSKLESNFDNPNKNISYENKGKKSYILDRYKPIDNYLNNPSFINNILHNRYKIKKSESSNGLECLDRNNKIKSDSDCFDNSNSNNEIDEEKKSEITKNKSEVNFKNIESLNEKNKPDKIEYEYENGNLNNRNCLSMNIIEEMNKGKSLDLQYLQYSNNSLSKRVRFDDDIKIHELNDDEDRKPMPMAKMYYKDNVELIQLREEMKLIQHRILNKLEGKLTLGD